MTKFSTRMVVGVAVLLILGVWQFTHYRRTISDENLATPSLQAQAAIELDGLSEGAKISSPLHISGRAKGGWYFEASFPIILTDWDGKIIAQTHATALSDWMTSDWVPFEATLEFPVDVSVSDRASLIFKKDNPSGEPQFDEARELTVYLAH